MREAVTKCKVNSYLRHLAFLRRVALNSPACKADRQAPYRKSRVTTLPSMSAYGAVGQDMAQVSSPFCHEFTTVLCCEPLLGRFLSSPMVVLLTIEGKSCSLSGHLPGGNHSETCVGCIVSCTIASNWLKSTSLRRVALKVAYVPSAPVKITGQAPQTQSSPLLRRSLSFSH